ncbi:transglycosylase domain-containing protein [Haloferula chungangensis]|uniref:peptidoglycan glycosyltransferase n=1 Tax=Haloferula chungangensis TaxID=1048331 RepID=A0ABW2L3G5_9BACT
MPKRSSKDSSSSGSEKGRNRRRNKPARKKHGLGTLLLFWPFALWQKITSAFPFIIRLPARLIGHPAILSLYFLIPLSIFYYGRARQFDMAKVSEMPERSIVLDRRGEELGRIHGEKRDIITFSDIAPEFLSAILAREDERFFSHGGVDWIGFARATLRNIKDQSMTQGASTITMQLARNSYQLQAKPLSFSHMVQELDRKFLEIAVSYRIESNYAKEEILTHYVNRIFWGHSIRGIEEASRTYFEKRAKDLTLSESALLAGIVRGPNAFSPFKDIENSRFERDSTLQRMVDAKVLSQEEADAAMAESIDVRPEWRRVFHDSWAMDAVRRELERILEEENIEFGGLQITTTIDNLVQKKAEEALDQHLRKFERGGGYQHQTRAQWLALPEPRPAPQYIQGSVVVIENLTGAIVATVGGRDADESKFNRASQAKRQIGSTFKPFVYLAAFDHGLRPDTMLSDDPLRRGEVKGAGGWSPSNSDGKFLGMQPASVGLIRSRNTMSVRVGAFAGIDYVKEIATSVGFERELSSDPTAFLGTLDASPEELASAYTVFPNRGVRFPPRLIAEIRNRDGGVEYRNPLISYEAVKPGSAWTTSRILHQVMESGTGASVKRLGFNKPCAGKTGTTNDYRDAWFVGYTSSLTCAVWVGLDQPKKTIDRGYGSTLSLPVWAEVMKTADRLGYKADGLDSKLSFQDCRICRVSGKRATPACESAGEAYSDSIPIDLVPAETDICLQHVEDVSEKSGNRPPKAVPVGELPPTEQAPKAIPADEEVPRAIPVEEDIPRAIPVE